MALTLWRITPPDPAPSEPCFVALRFDDLAVQREMWRSSPSAGLRPAASWPDQPAVRRIARSWPDLVASRQFSRHRRQETGRHASRRGHSTRAPLRCASQLEQAPAPRCASRVGIGPGRDVFVPPPIVDGSDWRPGSSRQRQTIEIRLASNHARHEPPGLRRASNRRILQARDEVRILSISR